MFKFAARNEVWWRIDLPDRDDNGELVLVPVRFRLRIYTRAELQAQKTDRLRAGADALSQAMAALNNATSSDEIAAANEELGKALDILTTADIETAAELADRIVGWNPADVTDAETGDLVEFSPDLRDALLRDEARYNALRDGLMEASHGARRKNSLPGHAGLPAPAQDGATTTSGRATTH